MIDRSNGVTASALIRPEGREPEVVAFETAVVSFFVDAAEVLGIPKSLAAIYGICFASARPLSFSDVRERLDLSAGSISQGIRMLRDVGAIKVVTTPLDRREFFAPDLELKKLIRHYIEGRLEKQLNVGRLRLEAIEQVLPSDSGKESKVLRPRLQSLCEWHDKTRALLPVVKSVLKLI